MLKKEDFIRFILESPESGKQKEQNKGTSALPEGFEGFGFETGTTPGSSTDTRVTFAQRLLVASDFGYPDFVQTRNLIRSTDSVAQYLPDRASYWPKTPSRPYQTLLFEADMSHKVLLGIPVFKSRKISHLDIVEDALARMVTEALDGFQRGGEGVTADVRKGRKEETLCIISIMDERDQEPVRLVCFGTQNAKTGGLETFHLTEQTRFWDQQLALDYLGLLYERQFKKLAGSAWQEAFTTTEERKQAEKLLEVCSTKAPTERDIQEHVLNLLDTIAKGFGLRCKPGQPRRLQAFALPPDHDIGIDPEEMKTKHGGRNPFGGVTLRDERNRLLGYIVYPLKAKKDAENLRKYLEKNNRFHNVLVVFPDGDETTLELWQGTEPLVGKLRKGKGFEGAAEVVNLLSRFFVVSKARVRNPTELAQELAYRARYLRRLALKELEAEEEDGPLRNLYNAFKEALVHDQTEEEFADAFAQTVTNGMLNARWIGNDRLKAEGKRFTRQTALDYLPTTNPFLRELFHSILGVKLDDQRGRFLWLVEDIADLLDRVDVIYVFGIGDAGGDQASDPIIHFYEPFLAAYDKQLKIQRGVFYTPRPVVSYIVRSVDELLRSEFGLADGLADTTNWGEMAKRHKDLKIPEGASPDQDFVQILDPATGTGTFLVEVIDLIHTKLVAKWKAQGHGEKKIETLWNEYVLKHLLTRLHGYELLMAPYAIAHLKIGLKLYETGYRFGSDERARVYLTNALEKAEDHSGRFEFAIPALAHEATAVSDIKAQQRFTVVIGNPPYSKSSQNRGPWIDQLMEDYKRTVRSAETQIQALSDDYSKFLRVAHYVLEESQTGILGFITNNGYLDGPLFRDMRSSMLKFFRSINVLNLHGDSRKQFSPPEGKADENVFDIQQGVAISLMCRLETNVANAVRYAELWGTREERYELLLKGSVKRIMAEPLQPAQPFYLFIPVKKELEAEFHAGWHLYDIFGTGNHEADNHEAYGAGFVTQQDKFAVGFSADELASNIQEFLNPRAKDEVLWKRFEFCSTNQWNFDRARQELKALDVRSQTKRFLYRPFDYRYTVFDRNVCTIIRARITMQFAERNLGLLTTRRVTRLPFNNIFVTSCYAEYKATSHDRNTIVFPLWIHESDGHGTRRLFSNEQKLNLSPAFVKEVASRLGLKQTREIGLPSGVMPEDILHYAYAVFHSPTYRSRYAEFLKIDFPRLPLTGNIELFRALTRLGGELVPLHLLESSKVERFITEYLGSRAPEVEKISWSKNTVWLDKSQTKGFKGVREDVWNFHIGGYQVCEKWLNYRKGRTLSKDDVSHYQKIVVALSETIRIMTEIDEVIEKHGGWPGAFQNGKKGGE